MELTPDMTILLFIINIVLTFICGSIYFRHKDLLSSMDAENRKLKRMISTLITVSQKVDSDRTGLYTRQDEIIKRLDSLVSKEKASPGKNPGKKK